MPASKKRIQRGAGNAMPSQRVPAALREWVHIWHGVQVRPQVPPLSASLASASASSSSPAITSVAASSAIFHSGSRMEELSFWQQFVRLPSNSLFSTSLRTIANPRRRYKDFLYVLLNMRWAMLMTVLLAFFLLNILAFAVLVFYMCGDPDSLQKSINLSYQTFSTIGFGIVYPATTCSNVVMVVESFASMLVTSAITGLVFAKFAKPKAKVAFSKVCVVQPYGKRYLALVVRVANATQSKDVTHDVIMESNFKLNLLRIERSASSATRSGSTTSDILCSYNLKLLQSNFITFRMGIAAVHVITEDSPLYGMSEAELAGSDMILEVSMSGVDSTLQDTVSERYTYTADSFKWGYRFAELLEFNERKCEVVMDFAKLSTIERAVIDDARYVHSPPVAPTRTPSMRGTRKTHGHEAGAVGSFTNTDGKSAAITRLRLSLDSDTTLTTGGSVTSQESISSIDNDARGLRAIDELSPDDLPETKLRLDRSLMEQEPVSSGAHGISRIASPRAPRRFSLGMEPLFEPLLQTSVGTQRLHADRDHSATKNNIAEATTNLLRATRLLSGSGGTAGPPPGLAADEIPIGGDFLMPEQQKRRLQDELMGEIQLDVDSRSSADDDNDEEREDEDDEDDEEDEEEGRRGRGRYRYESQEEELERRRRQFHTRSHWANQSAVSIDVQDTPRFLNISPINIPKSYDFMRLYNSALYERWPRIILVFVLAFVVINAVFALLYWFNMGELVAYPDINVSSYELTFFMSVHTLATIGYGSIAPGPTSSYMNFWVLVEASLGIIVTTIITGIAWSKFARPRAHIHFSSRIVVTTIFGHRCLVFRAANTRHSGDVHENLFRIGVILTNRKTGLRQLYDVPLVTAEWPSIRLPATLIHIIDESSPFFKFRSIDNLSESRVSVIVLLTGLDTTFSENVYARKMYFWDDFAWNRKFADFAVLERDNVVVDFRKFDELVPAGGDEYVAPTPVHEDHEEDDGEEDGGEGERGIHQRHPISASVVAV